MKRRKLTESEIKKLSKVINEKIESEVFIMNENNYVYFRCYDEMNSFAIGINRLLNLAVTNKKQDTKEYKYLIDLLRKYD